MVDLDNFTAEDLIDLLSDSQLQKEFADNDWLLEVENDKTRGE